MSGNINKAAADNLKNLCNKLKPIFLVAEQLDRIGDLDQAEDEAKQRAEKAGSAYQSTFEQLKKVSVELESAYANLQKAEDDADALGVASRNTEAQIIKDVNEKADKIIGAAADIRAQVIKGKNQAQTKLDDTKDLIVIAQEELQKVQDEIANTKSKISAL